MTLETFLVDLAEYLEANDIGPVSIAGNFEPFGNSVHIAPYGGLPSFKVITDTNPINLDLNMLIANDSNEAALALVFKAFRLMGDVHNKTIVNTRFLYIQAKYGPFFVGKMNNGLYHYTLNFSMSMA